MAEHEPAAVVLRIAVQRRIGVLARIAALFDRRRIEMWRVSIAPAGEADAAVIRVHTRAVPVEIERLRRAVENLVDVVAAEWRREDGAETDSQFP
jgi:acetolactate synthase small subunit